MINHGLEWPRRIRGIKAFKDFFDAKGKYRGGATGRAEIVSRTRLHHVTYALFFSYAGKLTSVGLNNKA